MELIKKFVTDEEFEELKRKKDIVVTFEFLGNKYGYPKKKMESKENSVVELHYSIIYQLKKEIKKYIFDIYDSRKYRNSKTKIERKKIT